MHDDGYNANLLHIKWGVMQFLKIYPPTAYNQEQDFLILRPFVEAIYELDYRRVLVQDLLF